MKKKNLKKTFELLIEELKNQKLRKKWTMEKI